MIWIGGPVSKVEAMQVAQVTMAQLGFRKPRAYGAWKEHGVWRISLKDIRGSTLLGTVDSASGRLTSAVNPSRYPKDPSPVKATGRPPERAASLALMQRFVPLTIRTDRWAQSWSDRIESYYRAFVGHRVLMDDRGLMRPYLLQDPKSGEPIMFYGLAHIPPPVTKHDRITRTDAERIAVAAALARPASTRPKVPPPLPALPALFVPKTGPAIPVWRVRVDSFFKRPHHGRRVQEDVLVNTQTGNVVAIVPCHDR